MSAIREWIWLYCQESGWPSWKQNSISTERTSCSTSMLNEQQLEGNRAEGRLYCSMKTSPFINHYAFPPLTAPAHGPHLQRTRGWQLADCRVWKRTDPAGYRADRGAPTCSSVFRSPNSCRKVFSEGKRDGSRKCRRLKSSSTVFWRGVPVRRTLCS